MNTSILDDFKNAWDKPNNSLAQIIIINVVIFVVINVINVLLFFSGLEGLSRSYMSFLALPSSLSFDGPGTSFLLRPWTIFTYMFVHERFFHILFNMLFLYWFGRIINEFLGHKRIIGLYVTGGLVGGLAYILLYNLFPVFQSIVNSSQLIGASAGVFAVVVGAAVFMPNYTFFLLFLGPVKIKYIALFYVFMSFIQTTGSNAGGEIAHLGGAAMGWLFITQLRKGNDLGDWVINVMNFFKSFFVKQPKIKVTHRSAPKRSARKKAEKKSARVTKTEQEEIDAILDKISQSGYESLSKDEKQKLFDASKK
ncbi:MAG: rhomboid family intramembrane serine protease [Cyclobacteriaceae bacterium]|nr:rhomboid family intramembrane serine protease [Cyclobacteriaceae bacterium HetDA_MAG_MS6]